MARPTKWRKIENTPKVPYFIPNGEIPEGISINTLLLEELEAVRLKDLEGMEQTECARHMEVSRPTFQRILLSAREKIADALIHGKMLRIEGGTYTSNICSVTCEDCNKSWEESYENLRKKEERTCACPKCGSKNIGCGTKKCGKRNCIGNQKG